MCPNENEQSNTESTEHIHTLQTHKSQWVSQDEARSLRFPLQ